MSYKNPQRTILSHKKATINLNESKCGVLSHDEPPRRSVENNEQKLVTMNNENPQRATLSHKKLH